MLNKQSLTFSYACMVFAAFLLLGCVGVPQPTPSPTATIEPSPSPEPGFAAEVSIRDGKLVPQNITVKVTETVKWTNEDPVDHALYFFGEDGILLESGKSLAKSFDFAVKQTYRIKDLTDEGWKEFEGTINVVK